VDHSITLITPAMHRQRGADAFDRGLGIDDHDMNPGSPAIADWKHGWIWRQAEARADRPTELAGIGATSRYAVKGARP
jgi:hypothetical protein